MNSLSATSLVSTANSFKLVNNKPIFCTMPIPFFYYRLRRCTTTSSPAVQYATQKRIQNTVRVQAGLYTDTMASLASYDNGVPAGLWNNASDRTHKHVQKAVVASGGQYTTSSTKHSITRLRPGAMSPGGAGCDIKHGSYDRHLNRLKGRSILRAAAVPSDYGETPQQTTVRGNKTLATGIVAGCNCPQTTETNDPKPTLFPNDVYDVSYHYAVNQHVYAKRRDDHNLYAEAYIIALPSPGYATVLFVSDGAIQTDTPLIELLPWFACDCSTTPTYSNLADLLAMICVNNNLSLVEIQTTINNYFGIDYTDSSF